MDSSTSTTRSGSPATPTIEARLSEKSFRAAKTSPKKGQAVTFGLGLEFNIAFTERVLQNTLDQQNINHTHIQKQHTDYAHSQMLSVEDYAKNCRSRYPSWGVAMPSDPEDPYTNCLLTTSKYTTKCEKTGNLFLVRPFISEPLLIARNLMEDQNLDTNIRAVIRKLLSNQPDIRLPGSKPDSEDYLLCEAADYSKWTLTNDHTLIGSLKSQLLYEDMRRCVKMYKDLRIELNFLFSRDAKV